MKYHLSVLFTASLLSMLASACATTKTTVTAADPTLVQGGANQAQVETAVASQPGPDETTGIDAAETTGIDAAETTGIDVAETTGIDAAETTGINAAENNGSADSVEASAGIQQPELTEIQKLAQAGNFAAARDMAMADYKSGKSDNLDEYWAYYEADPLMTQTLDESVRPHGTNYLSALGGGSTVSLKYRDSADESVKAAVKPDQDLRQTMYRSEVAYFRLCQLLKCSFDTPVTQPVRWSKSDFNALYDTASSKKNRAYSAKFEHIIWENENGGKYVYAAFKEWIPEFEPFPIEVSSAWALYLRPGTTNYPDLKTFFRNILNGARPDSIKHLSKLLEYAGDLTTRDILRQLSDITLVDYLTNNWDRYAGAQDNYGANCHFQPGGIIAIDNGAAFPAWHAPRVVKRLHGIQRFSKVLVENLRVLDPDVLFDHLFPNPTKEEMRSRDRFKERRAEALKYIDDLIKKHGEDQILVF